jgi:hypothetical protein
VNRAQWKAFYRQLRIIRRECAKATTDLVLFGNCFIKYGSQVPDLIQHVPLSEVTYVR